LRQLLIGIILDSKAGNSALEFQMEYRSIYITARDDREARKIGEILVWEKLAACVNFFPTKSIYWWKGEVGKSKEMAIIAKTRAELVDRVIERVKQVHSYEVPCIVSWVIDKGNPDYLEWIRESTEQG
jgi:periplasmic divalent cation tolerance protein